jgi:hypothetical protein
MDKAGSKRDLPEHDDTTDRGAERRPEGICTPRFGEYALRLFDNGYEPLPLVWGQKRPAVSRWSATSIDIAQVERWSTEFAGCGIGLRTGRLIGVDIDILDPEMAWQAGLMVERRLGSTLMRVGLWPKRLYLYRTDITFTKMSIPSVEVLARGQQFVSFGIHPKTGRPYSWPHGETPLELPLEDLPAVSEQACSALLGELSAIIPSAGSPRQNRRLQSGAASAQGLVRDTHGIVIDGRDGWLSMMAFHAVHDAIDAGVVLDADALAQAVWERFASSTNLYREKNDGNVRYDLYDCRRKVADKLRLLRDDRLPARQRDILEAEYLAPEQSVDDARVMLDNQLRHSCEAILNWYRKGQDGPAPQIGIRATVGLGKSAASRTHLAQLRDELSAIGAPSRILVFTPSHALAEETAERWREQGTYVAVLRGYKAVHPTLKQPMCQDIEAVNAAISAQRYIHPTACRASEDQRCSHFETCLKQQNRQEVAHADVVVAPYDVLFTGLAADLDTVGAVLIDEGCWARAMEKNKGLWVESFPFEGLTSTKWQGSKDKTTAAKTDLVALRQMATAAFMANGPGPVRRDCLIASGVTREICSSAIELEEDCMRSPHLYPGMPEFERITAFKVAAQAERSLLIVAVWRSLADLLASEQECDGRLRVLEPDQKTHLHELLLTGLMTLQDKITSKPVIHLDATMRPELARTILPRLEMAEINAAAPHMKVRLVTGSFGKGSLCQDPHVAPEENQRRANRLQDCVTYVRWQAHRFAPGKVLVVSNLASAAAFEGIAGVSVAHFNAIAGLDAYRNVALLIVIGRPLPSEVDLHPMCGAFFGHEPDGQYESDVRGVLMRDGSIRAVKIVGHEDSKAELMRAAICDDEVLQAVGRGRGVNRTASDPLEVRILANVALPFVHDQITPWEVLRPDVVQEMLLAGLAVDSPADAAALHPELFANDNTAKKRFEREAFKGQNPIGISYREMTLKSAAYRRPGRGRGWQRAWWIDGSADQALSRLEKAVGPVEDWSVK